MDAVENILGRKSVRSYTSQPVEQEKIELLLRARMAAPSGKNLQPWELVVVTERERLDGMAGALPYAKMLSQAPAAIIVCGDVDKSDYWYLDCSAVTQNILLAAEAAGLGAVWTAAYPYRERIDAVKLYVPMPANIVPLCVIPTGYPKGGEKSKNKFAAEKVHYNGW